MQSRVLRQSEQTRHSEFVQRVDFIDTLGKTNEKVVRRGAATQTVRWYGNGAVTKHKSA